MAPYKWRLFFLQEIVQRLLAHFVGGKTKIVTQKLDMLWQETELPEHFLGIYFFSGAMFGSIRPENETEVPGTFLGNQNHFLKRIGTKWKEQLSTFWTIENLNQFSIFSNFKKLLSCSAVFANLLEIFAVCAQKMGPQSLKMSLA